MGLTAAQVKAMVEGDLDNFIVASIPHGAGILAQEAQGQRAFVNSETLPKDGGMGRDSRETLALFGIEVTGESDELFYDVTLPQGWHKTATSHSMWSELRDEKGRIRAMIFYKAAFYDRSAHIGFGCRYTASYEPEGGWDAPFTPDRKYFAIVKDCGVEIWRSEIAIDNANKVAEAKLLELYPDAKNLTAYW